MARDVIAGVTGRIYEIFKIVEKNPETLLTEVIEKTCRIYEKKKKMWVSCTLTFFFEQKRLLNNAAL